MLQLHLLGFLCIEGRPPWVAKGFRWAQTLKYLNLSEFDDDFFGFVSFFSHLSPPFILRIGLIPHTIKWTTFWGEDQHDNPLEVGLEFAVDSERYDVFTGGNILAKLNESGIRRRRLLFELITEDRQTPLLLHDEPIYQGDRIVGLTTPGGLGPRTGLALSMGFVECEPAQTLSELCDHSYRILVAGTHYDARPLLDAPYDPGGKLMRG